MTEPVSAIARAAALKISSKNKYQVRGRDKNHAEPEPQAENSSDDSVDHALQALEAYLGSNKRSLDISVHEATGQIIVTVTSEEDGKIIREIPSREILDHAAKLKELAGLLFDESI